MSRQIWGKTVPIDLYSFVGIYDRTLSTLSHLLTKGAEHAKTMGAPEADMLNWRLVGDMQPLSFQAVAVINFTRAYMARAIGVEVPPEVTMDLDLAGFQAAIADAKAYLAGLTPEQFAGRDDVPLTVIIGNGMERPCRLANGSASSPRRTSISICRWPTRSCGPRVRNWASRTSLRAGSRRSASDPARPGESRRRPSCRPRRRGGRGSCPLPRPASG